MRSIGILEYLFFEQKKTNVQKKFNPKILTLMTFLLWISPGLGDKKPPDCKAQDPNYCASPCTYIKIRCHGNMDCVLNLCFLLHRQRNYPELERCWNLPTRCNDNKGHRGKRGILNKNVAYLLLKLHPFLNQTSQFGFLTSGRFRRITGDFGTELLGKRFNTDSTDSPPTKKPEKNPPKPKPTPKFYSLPLDKFSKSKILKRNEEDFFDSREKRLSIRGNGKIILGSEFLGKRGFYQNGKIRRFFGTEFLGKRGDDLFDGSEFLGKRESDLDIPGKTQRDPVSGTELLGKKNSLTSSLESEVKRFGNELLGKRMNEEELSELKDQQAFTLSQRGSDLGFWFDYDPKLIDEAYFTESSKVPKIPIATHFCSDNDSSICGRLGVK